MSLTNILCLIAVLLVVSMPFVFRLAARYMDRFGFRRGPVVVAFDCSGSVTASMLDNWMVEARKRIKEIKARPIHCLCFSADIERYQVFTRIEEFQPAFTGGGGTDVRPIFKFVTEQNIKPVEVLIFSDGVFEIRQLNVPQYPVRWFLTEPDWPVPFGTVVNL